MNFEYEYKSLLAGASRFGASSSIMKLTRLRPKRQLSLAYDLAKVTRKQAATKESLWPDWWGGSSVFKLRLLR